MPRRRKSLHRVTPYDGVYGLEGEPLELHQTPYPAANPTAPPSPLNC